MIGGVYVPAAIVSVQPRSLAPRRRRRLRPPRRRRRKEAVLAQQPGLPTSNGKVVAPAEMDTIGQEMLKILGVVTYGWTNHSTKRELWTLPVGYGATAFAITAPLVHSQTRRHVGQAPTAAQAARR